VNEAFAPQYLAVKKELGLNNDITNMNGGAIALGHPLAASGTRITGHLAHELQYVYNIHFQNHVFKQYCLSYFYNANMSHIMLSCYNCYDFSLQTTE
jgi:acetyl-CoA acetyltransferase